MSGKLVGKLRAVLGMDTRGFDKGADRSKRKARELARQFRVAMAAAAATGAAFAGVALRNAQEIDRTAKSARRLGTSIQGFRAMELAASEAGVSLASLTNEAQNIDREIASIGKSGNAGRALKELGLTAKDLEGLEADQKLAMIADRVKALGLNSGQATSLLRDLGVRNREMVLLLLQGGDALRKARKDVEDYGLALSDVDAGKIEQANDRIARLGLIGQYVGQQLALALVPRLGEMAKGMTDSLREGGALRGVIDGLAANLSRFATYIGTAVGLVGVRFAGAFVAAKVAAFSLTGALTVLRGALLRTGIGILIVGAGEIVYQFSRLVQGAGGFGNALGLLKDVAAEVWDRIKRGGALLGESLAGASMDISAAFARAFASIVEKFALMTSSLAKGWNSLMSTFGIETNASGLGEEWAAELRKEADELSSSAAAFGKSMSESWAGLAKEPFESVGALRAAVKGAEGDTNGAADAADRFNDSLDNLNNSAGGAAGGVKKVKPALTEMQKGLQSVKSSAKSAFAGLVTGAKSFREAISDVGKSLATMLANRAFEGLFGGLFGGKSGIFAGLIPGYANGTNNAPGGWAMVGERGRELVNLPRGSQVIPNSRTEQMMGRSGGAGRMDIYVHPSGEFDARVEGISGGVFAQGAPGLLNAADKRTGANMQNYIARHR